MPNLMNWNVLVLMIGLLAFTACGGTATSGEAADSATTFVDDTVSTDSDTEPEDDKQNRPSPPAEANGTVGAASVAISYSSPAVKGRTIWGELVPYDAVWRTGANEATVFEVSGDVTINGEALPAGKYGLFTIPAADGNWTLIFNETWDQWGAYNYDQAKDVLRVSASSSDLEESVERMKFSVGDDGVVTLSWDQLAVSFTVAAG